MSSKFRPPAVPLVTVDPYFNIWSANNQLHEAETRHWTGKTHGMVGMAVIDGKAWRFMGGQDRRSDFPTLSAKPMKQTGLEVRALSSIYSFEADGVRLWVDFTTPLLMDDLEVMGRPVSYVTFTAESIDYLEHSVQIYFDITAELCVDVPIQHVLASREMLTDQSEVLLIGTQDQPVLKRSGDDLRIDWGYACLIMPSSSPARTVISSVGLREQFIETLVFPTVDDHRFPRQADDEMPILAALIDLGTIDLKKKTCFLALAYDDIYSIEYFGERLPGYWKRNGQTRQDMFVKAIREYPDLLRKCDDFNKTLLQDAIRVGGEHYADILALAYRQAVAAHKLVADQEGNVLFFSKENFSNGCMATVDVSYPSIPLFLIYNPELVKGMMRPIFRYASSEDWPYEFAPHDVGRYPLANGQAYGMKLERQMPIEECGNMLIMAAAVCMAEGKPDFAIKNWSMLRKWNNYLLKYGMDPGNQLCTDDFGGHLAHNANLSIKAIIAIGCFGLLCRMKGNLSEGNKYIDEAKNRALQWEQLACEKDHYKLAFDAPGTWSMKYNLVWDQLLDLNLFPDEIRRKEIIYYIQKRNQYGTPLDSRKTYTKADWLIWAASMSETREQFVELVEPLWKFLNESNSRVPLTDWYYTIDGKMTGFINRSVVGGLFIQILAEYHLLSKENKDRKSVFDVLQTHKG